MAVAQERYGRALLEIALSSGKTEEYLDEAETLLRVIKETPELISFLKNPKVTPEEKKDAVKAGFKDFSDDITGLAEVMIDNGRQAEFKDVLEWFVAAAKEKLGIGVVYVTSAIALSDERKSMIEKKILETSGYKRLEVFYRLDESLIGGVNIRIRDRIIDNSIKTKLGQLTGELRQIQI